MMTNLRPRHGRKAFTLIELLVVITILAVLAAMILPRLIGRAEDAKVADYLKVFSFRSREEIEDLERQTAEAPFKRAAQRALADDVTDLVHGVEQRQAAVAAAAALFGRGELGELSEDTLRGIMAEVGGVEIGPETTVVDALLASGIVDSKSAARRAISEGGAYLNNQKVADPDAVLTADELLHGRFAVLRRGRKTVGGAYLAG